MLFDPCDVLLCVFLVRPSFLNGADFFPRWWSVEYDDRRDTVREELRDDVDDPDEMALLERHVPDHVSKAVRSSMRSTERGVGGMVCGQTSCAVQKERRVDRPDFVSLVRDVTER